MGANNLKPASIAGGVFDHYFHTCAFFRSPEEEYRVIGPFINEGLKNGEKAVYIVDDAIKNQHLERLIAAGVNLTSNPQQFDLLTWTQTYLQDGRFDKDKMLSAVRATIEAGLNQGFPRSRIVGQMSWAVEGHPGTDRLLEYEVEVNDVLARTRHPAVCVYDVNKLPGSLMMDLLRVHPMAIVGGALYENPFYLPAEKMLEELRSRKRGAAN